jgi:hypothetical protein
MVEIRGEATTALSLRWGEGWRVITTSQDKQRWALPDWSLFWADLL